MNIEMTTGVRDEEREGAWKSPMSTSGCGPGHIVKSDRGKKGCKSSVTADVRHRRALLCDRPSVEQDVDGPPGDRH